MLEAMQGFARVAAAVPACRVTDIDANAAHTLALWKAAAAQDVQLAVFPELGLCGYTARDLLHDGHLLARTRQCLLALARDGAALSTVALVGLPLRVGSGVFNVAAALHRGRVLAVVPKSYLPNYREFEEARWFRPGTDVAPGSTVRLGEHDVPFGTDIVLEADNCPDLVVTLELCEDLWVHAPPSTAAISAGATVVANLSASNFTIGKAELRRLLARASSDRGKCAYVYVAAGPGESSTDLAFDADAFVCENGRVAAESERFGRQDQLVVVDVDLEAMIRDRIATNTFGDCSRDQARPYRHVAFSAATLSPPLRRTVPRHPFIPQDPDELGARCWEIFEIQTNALATRMRAIGTPKLVLGVSGGLDSTQAALVAAGALDLEGQPRQDLVCVTMPGLGTTESTRGNAEALVVGVGGLFREISIREASRLMLELVGHPSTDGVSALPELMSRLQERPELGDVTLENVQARLRTLVLMTVANDVGGIVVGTGDLSEKALGWSTYAGDHIAMYDVNTGVPKTLIQSVIRWVANERVTTWSDTDPEALRATLFSILDTPISPELLPAAGDGAIAQLTEETIGPYELHDFYLYHFVRHGARPARILQLAEIAFGDDYDRAEHKRWLRVFVGRFFRQQFKRSCTADGPKVGQVALSPRGDWRMPSDASVTSWLAEIDAFEG